MKKIVCEKPNQFFLTEASYPSPEKGEAIVRIQRIGICGTDLHAYQGDQPFFEYPRVLGHELSGVIESIETNSAGLKKGNQVSILPYISCGVCVACRNEKPNCCVNLRVIGVHIDGGMAEFLRVPVQNLIQTDGLSPDQAAVIEPLAIGAHAIRRADIDPGSWVLVIGGGPIGTGVMALARHKGARVIAMDINEDRLAFCENWAKAGHTVNALHNPIEKLKAITGGDLPDVVFDATGSHRSMNTSFDYVSHGGKLVFVGLVKKDITFSDPVFHAKELTLLSSRNATREDFQTVIQHLQDGRIDIRDYITHRSDFDQMTQQFGQWLLPDSGVMKAIVEI